MAEKRIVFTTCLNATELALTRAGSNPGSHMLVTRSAPADQSANTPENTDMDPKAVARLIATSASWDDVTRSHYAGLSEDAQVAFLERTADEQKTEAAEAKRKVDEAASAEAARKAGVTEGELALQRKLDEKDSRIAALEAKDAERSLMDVARSDDFKGYPGGAEAVAVALRNVAGQPEVVQTTVRDALKQAATAARATGMTLGHSDISDVTRGAVEAARKRIDDATDALVTERKIERSAAWEKVTEDPKFAADVALVSSVQ